MIVKLFYYKFTSNQREVFCFVFVYPCCLKAWYKSKFKSKLVFIALNALVSWYFECFGPTLKYKKGECFKQLQAKVYYVSLILGFKNFVHPLSRNFAQPFEIGSTKKKISVTFAKIFDKPFSRSFHIAVVAE